MSKTRRLVLLGLLSAMAFLLMFLLEFPLPFVPPFLKYNFSGIPSLLAAIAIGPWAGVAVEFVKDVLFFLSGKDPSGFIGPSADFLAGALTAFVAGMVYRHYCGRFRLALSLAAGAVISTLVMVMANFYVFLPLYNVPHGQIAGMLAGAILPFNLAKGLITGVTALAILRRFRPEQLGW